MKDFLLLVFCGIAAGQLSGLFNSFTDRYHEMLFEYHPTHDVLLARTTTECYFIRVTPDMENLIKQQSSRYELMEKIYTQIHSHTGEHRVDVGVLQSDLHDFRATLECRMRQVYELTVAGTEPASTAATDAATDTMFTDMMTTDMMDVNEI